MRINIFIHKNVLKAVDSSFPQEAISIVKRTFSEKFSIRDTIDVAVGEGAPEGYDFCVATDPLPTNTINAAQKIKTAIDDIAVEFRRIIPSYIGFSGKGLHCDINKIIVDNEPKSSNQTQNTPENDFETLAKQYSAEKPKFTFAQIVLAPDVKKEIEEALAVLEHRSLLFDTWGLKSIMSPSVLLNLYGASGTGKTMAAEAIAQKLGKNIIKATYADIESKWHGEGPQKLKAIFLAATNQDAILFIDEADSMLSSRLNGVSNGSEQAINSMRSQLLICLENFDGIVIFATNLINNYDPAFLTRLICVELKKPDKDGRKLIWHNHLYPTPGAKAELKIPADDFWDLEKIAADYEFVGRDIRNAVKKACIHAVVDKRTAVSHADLIYACDSVKKQNDDLEAARNKIKITETSQAQKDKITSQIIDGLKTKKEAEAVQV
jgi:SpoVK/Ycf46/Vps4 family AAA+-type ATPase